jgi:hypothetical protein
MAIELQEVRQSAKHHVGQYFWPGMSRGSITL